MIHVIPFTTTTKKNTFTCRWCSLLIKINLCHLANFRLNIIGVMERLSEVHGERQHCQGSLFKREWDYRVSVHSQYSHPQAMSL